MDSELLYQVRFFLPGIVPSKSNYRQGKKGTNAAWAKIKEFEHNVGWYAKANGAKIREGLWVYVNVGLVNQTLDADNALKSTIDALKGVCIEDDDKDHMRGVSVLHLPDVADDPPGMFLTLRWYEPDAT